MKMMHVINAYKTIKLSSFCLYDVKNSQNTAFSIIVLVMGVRKVMRIIKFGDLGKFILNLMSFLMGTEKMRTKL